MQGICEMIRKILVQSNTDIIKCYATIYINLILLISIMLVFRVEVRVALIRWLIWVLDCKTNYLAKMVFGFWKFKLKCSSLFLLLSLFFFITLHKFAIFLMAFFLMTFPNAKWFHFDDLRGLSAKKTFPFSGASTSP